MHRNNIWHLKSNAEKNIDYMLLKLSSIKYPGYKRIVQRAKKKLLKLKKILRFPNDLNNVDINKFETAVYSIFPLSFVISGRESIILQELSTAFKEIEKDVEAVLNCFYEHLIRIIDFCKTQDKLNNIINEEGGKYRCCSTADEQLTTEILSYLYPGPIRRCTQDVENRLSARRKFFHSHLGIITIVFLLNFTELLTEVIPIILLMCIAVFSIFEIYSYCCIGSSDQDTSFMFQYKPSVLSLLVTFIFQSVFVILFAFNRFQIPSVAISLYITNGFFAFCLIAYLLNQYGGTFTLFDSRKSDRVNYELLDDHIESVELIQKNAF